MRKSGFEETVIVSPFSIRIGGVSGPLNCTWDEGWEKQLR